MGNDGIYSVGTESLYQIGQSVKIECFASVSQEGLTRELFAKHSYLHPVLTLHILVMCRAYALLLREAYLQATRENSFSLQLALSLHTLFLSHTTLTSKNPYEIQGT